MQEEWEQEAELAEAWLAAPLTRDHEEGDLLASLEGAMRVLL